MISKKELEKCARSLMLNIDEKEYEMLIKELIVILKEIESFEKIDGLIDVEPMTFPFVTYKNELREDCATDSLDINDVLKNTNQSYLDQIKLPKVVE
ncbi:MAG: Asp-tRNA(Asn)/Glu-tRNA(Gln) amidotransferase subunit GatC [Bacilli bacterium]|nr:Asp-tRNA(Asn)/Glu-tRNA(Gln) amidotransferase subunit GatC [Bacilli bacterium]MDD4283021.1 Asp-tRNA(Asn)/Glu-tRNA(Gln) amidotransferase subunit GatC [Bacilli bacterium]MDD4718830.1 Asp-tRNA(Asn)/Glu-tRNA(Gln) amidotransferase subunit GatC [Bacilli bacterium]